MKNVKEFTERQKNILLQMIDCNCNDCIFMKRDIEKFKSYDELHGYSKNASHRIQYGFCEQFKRDVSFIPNICQLDTQECFKHRREHEV